MDNRLNIFQSGNNYTIPNEAVRVRIIANSNSPEDQGIKLRVKDEIINFIYPKVKDIKDYQVARRVIYDHMDEIENIISNVLQDQDFSVDYGIAYFPSKNYQGLTYPEGTYESVYIVIGEGKGDNWWCVLFPPLCLIDVAVDGEFDRNADIKYEFLIIKKLKNLLGL